MSMCQQHMRRFHQRALTLIGSLCIATGQAVAGEVAQGDGFAVAPLFTDHMILQEGMPVPVWGWSHADDLVTVEFAGQKVSTKAGADGRWEARLAPLATSTEGRSLTIVHGAVTTAFRDVLVGEVWLCSGQSNMAMRLPKAEGGEKAAADANDPSLRLFSTDDALPNPMPAEPRLRTFAPRSKPYGWNRANPDSAADMSAAAWYFAQELRRELKKPVGLILASRGGTVGEAWISSEALRTDPSLAAYLSQTEAWKADFPSAQQRSLAAQAAWKKACDEARSLGKPLPPKPVSEPALNNISYASGCYDNFIAAIHPYAVRGVLWYQGEGNSGPNLGRLYGTDYQLVLTTLIRDWRAHWGQERLPFYIVQLANFVAPNPIPPAKDGWAEVREAQAKVAATVPDCALAVAIDIGDAKDIHPRNKAEVGRRLALVARAKTYGQQVAYAGPTYSTMTIRGSELWLNFDNATEGLRTKGGTLTGFALAGADRQWHWAEARIEGVQVVLASAKVPVLVLSGWT